MFTVPPRSFHLAAGRVFQWAEEIRADYAIWSDGMYAADGPHLVFATEFVGHPDAGKRSAVIYTLLGSCRRHGINPFDYMKDLFTRLPAAKITQIQDFTPTAWASANNGSSRRVFM